MKSTSSPTSDLGGLRLGAAVLLVGLATTVWGASIAAPEAWVPARWNGTAPIDLLEGSPVNCLLFAWSTGQDADERQQARVRDYARQAHERGIAVLGVVNPGAVPSQFVPPAIEAGLDGLVLDGEFAPGFTAQVEQGLRSRGSTALVIPIAREPASVRATKTSLVAVQGVRPGARNLAEMGIRAGPSAESWIDSNIWLVRSFRLGPAWRPVWVSQEPKAASLDDYLRCAAEAAVAGGRWIVALDEGLWPGLIRKDTGALAIWQGITSYLRFAEEHADWRSFTPYGNLAIILDPASPYPQISNEYLNLVARRQVPYRVVARSDLSLGALDRLQAVVAADLARPTDSERQLLRAFAERGGVVAAGPWWTELPDKQRVTVYKDDPPDPEQLARDLVDLLSPEEIGVTVFNVPSALTYASTSDSGNRVLVQLLNYSRFPAEAITLRVNGSLKSARLFAPALAPAELPVARAGSRTEVTLRKIEVWGAVLLER